MQKKTFKQDVEDDRFSKLDSDTDEQSEFYWRGRKRRNTLAKGDPPPESQLNLDLFQVNNSVY